MRSYTASPGRYKNTGRRIVLSLRPLVSGSLLFAVLFGSTVDTFYVSLQRLVGGAVLGQGVLAICCATTGSPVPQLQFSRSLTSLFLRCGLSPWSCPLGFPVTV